MRPGEHFVAPWVVVIIGLAVFFGYLLAMLRISVL